MRASRLEIRPGGTRRLHQHDDVQFHLFIPASGSIRLTRNAETIDAVVGQVYFLDKGTPHMFANAGTSSAGALEVFVKPREFTSSAGAPAPASSTAAPPTREVDPGVFNTSPTLNRAEMPAASRSNLAPRGGCTSTMMSGFTSSFPSRLHPYDDERRDDGRVVGQVYFINKGTPHTFTNRGARRRRPSRCSSNRASSDSL